FAADAVAAASGAGRAHGLDRPGGAHRQHGRGAAGRRGGADRELDRARPVRGHGVAESGTVDAGAGVVEGDGAGDVGDALDADEDVHGYLLMRSLSGSNSGVESTEATVTG